ncbi:MAG: DUF5916 domain-containing protein, partial [Bacteroidota bacterium]
MKNYQLLCLGLCLLFSTFCQAQEKSKTQAVRITESVKIDGSLDEAFWKTQAAVSESYFTQNSPNNGDPSEFKTRVYTVYDDKAIYFAAELLDPNPELIATELGLRDSDDSRNTDMFGVSIDTYNKQQNAFNFRVSAAGVQTDQFITPNGWDQNWDAVWNSAVQKTDEGWIVEIEIPYFALRFPKEEVQTWGINFFRLIQRKQEYSYWNPVDASVSGFVNQFGELSGLESLEPPLRLSITPYLTAYAIRNEENQTDFTMTGGADLKWGLNEAFTLDMTLVPDFGQVQSDNVILNLSPFEVRFAENRPFFTEGVELFAKGDVFYSRRVGQSTHFVGEYDEEREELVSTPNEAPLLNATKISGRTAGGTGIGFFNAVTNHTYATVKNKETGEKRRVMADPLTNFNVMVVDQNLKNNSNISLINTNVTRWNGGRDANVTGVDFRFRDKTNTYQARGSARVSQVWTNDENGERKNTHGYRYNYSLGKVSGTWQYNFGQNVESKHYNPNDMGFLGAPNEVSSWVEGGYNRFKPFMNGKILSFSLWTGIWHEKLEAPNEFVNMGQWANMNVRFKNFWNFGANFGTRFTRGKNWFTPRVEGRHVDRPQNSNLNFWAGTDSRKKLRLNAYGGIWWSNELNQLDNWFGITPRFRASDKLTINHSFEYTRVRRERDWATHLDEEDAIIFGQREREQITNTMNIAYTFNALMGVTFRARHYWSKVWYQDFFELNETGWFDETAYDGMDGDTPIHDTNFNAFNIDLVYFWQFAPG